MTPLDVRVVPVADLIPAAYNPRKVLKPSSPAYRKLRASIEAFGLVEPLVWNESTGRVVGGHARLRILRDLGAEAVAVSVVRLSEEREKALNLVLNNAEAQGRYDPAKLADVLAELENLPELVLSGFDQSTLAALRLEPVEASAEPVGPARVEVTLVIDPDVYAAVAPRLDELVREFDLESHVKRTGEE